MAGIRRDISFASGDLTLEGCLHLPDSGGGGKYPGVAICHPHPQYGGDMYNVVVASLADSLCAAGIAALRFHFRGVDMSEGSFDGGVGEIDDAVEAMEWLALQDEVDGSRIGIAGYSFGAAVALAAARGGGVAQAVASIACPSRVFNEMGAQEILQPKLLMLGEHDHDFPLAQFKFQARRYSEPRQIEVIDGADHFFGGHVSRVCELTTDFFRRWLGAERG